MPLRRVFALKAERSVDALTLPAFSMANHFSNQLLAQGKLDEEVARLPLEQIGGKLTQVHTAYLGVPIDGQFWPEQYR